MNNIVMMNNAVIYDLFARREKVIDPGGHGNISI